MSAVAVELRPTIDRRWLQRAAEAEPLTHAYALWDLDRTPEAIRFVSAVRGEETVGYLLIWLGLKDRPIVHWFGEGPAALALLEGFPSPPFQAVVPPSVEPQLRSRYPEARSSALLLMEREPRGPGIGPPNIHRLRRTDLPALTELLRRRPEPELAGYAGLDPGAEAVWGAVEGTQLVGVARASVRLPRVWVVGGVYVDPTRRNAGLGRALVGAVAEEAERSGAVAGLYVRREAGPALALYERLGFHEVGRRMRVDVAARGP